jgi:hypothetical protein
MDETGRSAAWVFRNMFLPNLDRLFRQLDPKDVVDQGQGSA